VTATRRIRQAGGWLLVAVLVVALWPVQIGGHLGLVIVAGHSMDGTYRNGDLLLTWPEPQYRQGDVIVYRVPDGEAASGLRVVHRVVGGDALSGFVSQGDNRDTTDIWRPKPADIDGSPFAVVPYGGLALRWLLSPIALALLCAVCVYLFVLGDSRRDNTDATGLAEPVGSGH
jgi:signal peptidase